jgi:hypothetical protein
VRSGKLRVRVTTTPPLDVVLEAGSAQAIPPGVDHWMDSVGRVSVSVEDLVVDRSASMTADESESQMDEPGDPACWAGLLCPECGGVAGDGSGHRPECSAR